MAASRDKAGARESVQGGHQPHWLRWLGMASLVLLISGGLVWGVVTLRDPAVLPLKVVRIDGELKNINRRTLEQAVSGAITGNFFTVDLERVRAAALKLPWVYQVTVRRIWPGTLNMWVVEQQPLARWGERQLVNESGGVFTPEAKTLDARLPDLYGPDGRAPEVVEHYTRMESRFAKLQLSISRLVMDQRGSWTVGFAQGIELQLGNKETEVRVDRFVKLYPHLTQTPQRKIKRVDMRYANGVAVLWGDAS